ncbi:PPOX class F420-dependent oxidoreductase [Actinomycetes bacterium KLBMP 9759]
MARARRAETFKFSTDPQLVAKVTDVVGLYLARRRTRSCCVWTSQVQALDRSQPMPPIQPRLSSGTPMTTSVTAPSTAVVRGAGSARSEVRFLPQMPEVFPDMTVELPDEARQLLDEPHTAVLATTNSDGSPQSSVIFVKPDGHTVVLSTIRRRLKTRNMERDPRVSLLVAAASGRYVEIRGHVDITDDPQKTMLHEMYARYMGGATPPPEPGSERVIVRIHPDKVRLWPPLPTPGDVGVASRSAPDVTRSEPSSRRR